MHLLLDNKQEAFEFAKTQFRHVSYVACDANTQIISTFIQTYPLDVFDNRVVYGRCVLNTYVFSFVLLVHHVYFIKKYKKMLYFGTTVDKYCCASVAFADFASSNALFPQRSFLFKSAPNSTSTFNAATLPSADAICAAVLLS